MNLPKPKKSLEYLRDKMATKKSFYVSDFDKKCIDSLIAFYNVVEGEVKTQNDLYYKLIYIFIRYEIVNKRLNQDDMNQQSIKDIFQKIEKLIFKSDIKTELVKMLLECQSQKTDNFFKSKQELTKDNLSKLHFSESDTEKATELINDFIFMNILNQQK